MADSYSPQLVQAVRTAAHPLTQSANDYDPLLTMIGDAQLVLIGEASHGTHEFYRERALITRRLIEERGFNAVAVEADWPDAYRVNEYVHGYGADSTSIDALSGFERFPTWMWRNADVLDFVGWLRAYNDQQLDDAAKVGFYGLDLYSLYTSIESVLTYLDDVDPDAATRARYRYGCFEHFGEDTQAYGYAASFNLNATCERAVLEQLIELQRRASKYAHRDGHVAEREFFSAEQNARLVKNAEAYYRTMFSGRISSWNLRDQHMAETLDELIAFLSTPVRPAKIVVWEHNSHLGDARATEMSEDGEWNVGQLVRQTYGDTAVLVGFSTYTGTVTAASNWDEPAQLKQVRPGLPGSCEALFHDTNMPRLLLPLRDLAPTLDDLRMPRLQRAIGVIYRPQTERQSHYFYTRLPDQFDAMIHIDRTRAVEPLDRSAHWPTHEPPETYPTGI